MSTSENTINGIDVDRLQETVEDLRADGRMGRLRLRAHNRWIDGAHGCTIIEDFRIADEDEAAHQDRFEIDADEPEMLLGTDTGPNATEMLLHALASCLNTSFVYQASARGIEIDSLELEVEGDLDLRGFMGVDPAVRNGFQQIRVTFRVVSEASPEEIEELCQAAQDRSPVYDTLVKGTRVRVELEE
jgi:uncharacterized OsmC-like protein